MRIYSLKLVYYSPTGTTKKIIQSIAQGIGQTEMELVDITTPNGRGRELQISEDELLIVGIPVYMGRVPELLMEWLNAIKANNTPTICVIVYGNRVYDDALLELKNVLSARGCLPVACAAYIAEHSFSSSETPIAEARPDVSDINHAELFGRKVKEKLQSITSLDSIPEIKVPGVYPYRGDTKLWNVDFIEVDNMCSQCGICAEVCPVGAVDSENSALIDIEKCITCCACIKSCPQNARKMKPGMVRNAALRLNNLYKERKEPELFF